jgi:hypothetical protein
LFVGALVQAWWLVVFSTLAAIVFITMWLWPKHALAQTAEVVDV